MPSRTRPDVTTAEILGGPEALKVGLHSHDARWKEDYLLHRHRILGALATLGVGVEHIGSTSVPGLAAKPIIDIVVTVPDITAEETQRCRSTSCSVTTCAPMPTIVPSTRASNRI